MKTFRAFGPTIGKGKLSRKFINTINSQIDKSIITKKNDYSSKLASQIKNELKISTSFIEKHLSKELIKNIKSYLKVSKIEKIKEIKIINLWVVKQLKNEYNPIHYHNGHVSGVGYLKLPDNFGETVQSNKKNNLNGHLSLIHGNRMFNSSSMFNVKPKVGDFYFFPNYMMHTVFPFYGLGERRSISFNANIDEEIYNVYG